MGSLNRKDYRKKGRREGLATVSLEGAQLFFFGLSFVVLHRTLKIADPLTKTLAKLGKPARPKDEQGDSENDENFRKAKSKRHKCAPGPHPAPQSGLFSLLPNGIGRCRITSQFRL